MYLWQPESSRWRTPCKASPPPWLWRWPPVRVSWWSCFIKLNYSYQPPARRRQPPPPPIPSSTHCVFDLRSEKGGIFGLHICAPVLSLRDWRYHTWQQSWRLLSWATSKTGFLSSVIWSTWSALITISFRDNISPLILHYMCHVSPSESVVLSFFSALAKD